ncbi:MAG: restriction endonuclease [Vicinamibacterales bacterium]
MAEEAGWPDPYASQQFWVLGILAAFAAGAKAPEWRLRFLAWRDGRRAEKRLAQAAAEAAVEEARRARVLAEEKRVRAEQRRASEREREAREAQRRRQARLRTLSTWKRMSPREFELEVAALFERCGSAAVPTPASNDAGVDIRLKFRGRRYAVQCKRYGKGQVGRPACQQLWGASDEFDGAVVVTTSVLSRQAREFCSDKGIAAITGSELSALINAPSEVALARALGL